jgi:hypothetical protein
MEQKLLILISVSIYTQAFQLTTDSRRVKIINIEEKNDLFISEDFTSKTDVKVFHDGTL